MPTDAELIEMAQHLARLSDLQTKKPAAAMERYVAIARGLTDEQVDQLANIARQLGYCRRFVAVEPKP